MAKKPVPRDQVDWDEVQKCVRDNQEKARIYDQERELRAHREQQERLQRMERLSSMRGRPPKPKYEPAPMPSDEDIDAVLAQIRKGKPNAEKAED